MVDAKHIRFTDPESETRWEFETPKKVVKTIIETFDKKGGKEALKAIPLEDRTFTLRDAIQSYPMVHHTPQERATMRRNWAREYKRTRTTPRTKSGAIRTINRYSDEGFLMGMESTNGSA